MKQVDPKTTKLFKVLQTAYRDRPALLPDDQWERDVMRRIHHLASPASDGSLPRMLEQLTWRLSPITLGMIIACGVALVHLEIIPDWQVLQLITNGMEEINLYELFI